MTGQDARDDEREAMIEHLRVEARRLARYAQPCGVPGCPFMVRRGDGGWSHLDTHGVRPGHAAIGCLDAAVDALARKHPEPEITEAVAAERERAARHADEGYRWGENCDDIAKRIRSGEPAVALRVPVGEGEQ